MNNLRKRKNGKHEGKYLWIYLQHTNKDGNEYHTCQYVAVEKGKVKSHAQVGVKETAKYRDNLAKHETLTKKSLRARMHDTMNDS